MSVPQLFVVGTPIGNLGDWSPRGQEVLGTVQLIACEETRRTGALLSKHGIANPGMVDVNEHTEGRSIDRILETLANGDSVALVSDAGMPTISDPVALSSAPVEPTIASPPSTPCPAKTVPGAPVPVTASATSSTSLA